MPPAIPGFQSIYKTWLEKDGKEEAPWCQSHEAAAVAAYYNGEPRREPQVDLCVFDACALCSTTMYMVAFAYSPAQRASVCLRAAVLLIGESFTCSHTDMCGIVCARTTARQFSHACL